MRFTGLLVLIFLGSLGIGLSTKPAESYDGETKVWKLLEALGDTLPTWYEEELEDSVWVRRGKELFHFGKTTGPNGEAGTFQSIHYTCTSCHNAVREDPDLTKSDPNARLAFAKKHQLPYLQGTTMYGTVNKTSWYNGDYYKKYGDLVKPAQKDVRGAIELCAIECSQGRPLKEWEMKAMLAYLWQQQYKLSDLEIPAAQMLFIQRAEELNKEEKIKLRELITSNYLTYSPATFGEEIWNKKEGYGEQGRVEDGEFIYKNSCLHCHTAEKAEPSGYLVLEDDKLSRKLLARKMTKNHRYSIYRIIRKGTYATFGHSAYMPHYTLERMSDQQIESLRAYLEQESKSKGFF